MNAPGTAAEGVLCCLLIVKIYYWCTIKILTISVYFNYTIDYLYFYEHGLIAVKRQNNLNTATRR